MQMRVLSCAAVLLFSILASRASAQTPGTPHTASLRGSIVAPICSSETFATGEISGDFSGAFSIAFDCANDGRIASGTWSIAITGIGPDGAIAEIGTIGGLVQGGSFEADSGGSVVSVRSVELAVTHGTGVYAAAASGTGTLQAVSDPNAAPQFLGTLGLSF